MKKQKMPKNIHAYFAQVMYNLYYAHDVEEINILGRPFSADYIKLCYSGQWIASVIQALDWAIEHEDYDFQNMDVVRALQLSVSNKEIFTYIETFRQVLIKNFDQQMIESLNIPEDSRKLKVLIVDDAPAAHEFATNFFRETPYLYTTIKFNDVHDILSKIARERFDILIINANVNDPNIFSSLLKKIRDFERKNDLPSLPILNLIDSPISSTSSLAEEIQKDDKVDFLVRPAWYSSVLRKVYELTI